MLKPTVPCKFYAQGSCKHGARCRFLHSDGRPGPQVSGTSGPSSGFPLGGNRRDDGRATKYRAAKTHYTSNNKDLLGENGAGAKRVDKGKGVAKPQPLPENHERVLGGSMSVVFGPGLHIESVTPLLATSSTVVLTNLPPDITNAEVHALTLEFQRNLPHDAVRLTRFGGGEEGSIRTRATISLADTSTANRVIKALDGRSYRGTELACRSQQPTGASNNTTKINCCWTLPSTFAYVKFDSNDGAKAAVQNVGGTIRGQTVRVQPPRPFHGKFSVMVTGIDATTTVSDIAGAFMCSLSAVTLKCPAGAMPAREATEYIKAFFTEAKASSPLAAFDVITDPSAKLQRALVRFESPEDTRNVAKQLDGKYLTRLGGTKLKAELTYSSNFTVPRDVYNAVAEDLKAFSVKKHEEDGTRYEGATLKIGADHVKTNRPVALYVNGQDRKAVANLKAAVQKIVRGEIVRDPNGRQIWDSALNTWEGRKLVKQAVSTTGAYLYCDNRQCIMVLYGTAAARDRARETLFEARVVHFKSREHEIPLDEHAVEIALRGGFTAVQEHLKLRGLDTAHIDIPGKRIIINCTASETQLIKNLFRRASKGKSSPESDTACVACMMPAEDPTRAACGHIYCKDCALAFINSVMDTRTFPITCFGHPEDATPCASPFPIDFIRFIMPAAQMEELCRLAFSTYIQQHSDTYLYCTTADCETVFKISSNSDSAVSTCQQCFAGVCTHCKAEAHDGQTCDEFQATVDPKISEARFREWTQSHDVKTCPRCSAVIEKTEGCNHMRCRCGTHLCWLCLGVFDEHVIYRHIAECAPVARAPATVTVTNGDAEFQRWRRLHDIKTCPRCGFDIEKMHGDNHVVCHCGAHLCWLCVGVFEPHEVYWHVRRCQVHDGGEPVARYGGAFVQGVERPEARRAATFGAPRQHFEQPDPRRNPGMDIPKPRSQWCTIM